MLKLRPLVRPSFFISKRALLFVRSQHDDSKKISFNVDQSQQAGPQVDMNPADIVPESYPDVPRELYYNRDPYAPWDDKQNRRNFNEPLHEDEDILNLWSPEYYQYVDDKTAVKWVSYFFLTIAGFSGFCYMFLYPKRVAVPRNYPHDGLSRALGAKNAEEAEIYGARVDKTAY